MNVELQSANQELQAISEELRRRTTSLHDVNAFLESVPLSLAAGVAVLDPGLRVQAWNEAACDPAATPTRIAVPVTADSSR
jgi:two-component system CheB/CheR fusion protein